MLTCSRPHLLHSQRSMMGVPWCIYGFVNPTGNHGCPQHLLSLLIKTGRYHRFLDHLGFGHIASYLAVRMNIILSLSVQFSSRSETSITPFSMPADLFIAIHSCPEGPYDCLQVWFRLCRHCKHLLLIMMFLATMAHLCNLVGWLKM